MEDDKVIKGPEMKFFINFLLLSESLHSFSTTLLQISQKKEPLGVCVLCAQEHIKYCVLYPSIALPPLHPSSSSSLFMLFIQEIHELKDQILDVEAKHMQNLKELKVHGC